MVEQGGVGRREREKKENKERRGCKEGEDAPLVRQWPLLESGKRDKGHETRRKSERRRLREWVNRQGEKGGN